jgi:hypothetical protein
VLIRRSSNLLTFRNDGLYSFSSLENFALDMPDYLQITVARQGPQALPAPGITPNYSETFSNDQFYGFVQDNVKMTRTLGLNLGLRYESFGAPKETGGQNGYFQPGPGANVAERLANGSMVYPTGQHSIYRPDRNNWAPRIGVFFNLPGNLVFRASYGVFYDRPFELLTQSIRNNSMIEVTLKPAPSYPQIVRAPNRGAVINYGNPQLLWVDSNLRTPYVQGWFGGVQHQVGRSWYFEAQAQGALGRKLISTDVVNRQAPTVGRLNQRIAEDISFRSNAASSSYAAFTSLAEYRSRRGQAQVAYTWGHSIDNQSDPLQGTFDDLQLTPSNTTNGLNRAGFTRQFETAADRASSDFDQRHNLVARGIWYAGVTRGSRLGDLVLSNWQFAGMAAFRSGFPFNLVGDAFPSCPGSLSTNSASDIMRNRPNLLPGRDPFLSQRASVPGGYQLLDLTAFCDPGPETVGNLGRNALTGSGFWNADLSVAKSFQPTFLGESGAMQIRADFFNAFNHANLGNPDIFGGPALLGRQGVQPSFPSGTPLDQLARQVQLQLKILF